MRRSVFLFSVYVFAALFGMSAVVQGSTVEPRATRAEQPKRDDSPLLAKWEVTISAPGQELPGTLKLEKDGDSLKGGLTTDLGEAPLTNIKITDNTFTADMTANVQGQTFAGTMTGKLEDGKLSGEISLSGLGTIPYSGKKQEN